MVWNIRHCSPTHLLEGHTGAVFAVELDGSAQLAYTGSGDKVTPSLLVLVHVHVHVHTLSTTRVPPLLLVGAYLANILFAGTNYH